ncbi:enoyl-CoA hydratase/isomerase family protein [Haloarcula sp. JP-L23]|uniref:enoyl-CoA hydratase/isomerase family protein n=1 Tax=Haloarcula sp. JP-L23 TaxID=2716717 RepID=UPI00140E9768|nr:enoyl-CoA hydratase/isomerase family protein [Haloarcula sp. JP-L23]
MVRVESADRVYTLSFDRPETKNSFTVDAANELVDALETAESEDARAVVVTGDGDAFCAGGDIDAMAERDETPTEAYQRLQSTLNTVIERILTAPFPVIAKVNGDAVGAGTNISAACDFAYADSEARFGEVFGNVGLIPDSGGTFLLPALVGLRTAKELTMTGRLFDAEEAAEMDLINRAVSEDELDESVEELLDTLKRKPTETLGLTKRGIHENIGRPFRDALEREAYLQTLAYGSEAHEIGVNAFLQDERPDFR